MLDVTGFATQWAGLVAHQRLLATHAPGSRLIEQRGMVASIISAAPNSSVMNVALSVDPALPPTDLRTLATAFKDGGANKWGLWVDAEHEQAAEVARDQGMVLDSRPTAMVAELHTLPFGDAPPCGQPDLATVGRVNDAAYGYAEPKLAPAIASLPREVRTYGDGSESVAMAYDVGSDTAVWFVATVPRAQGQGRAGRILQRLMLEARDRGQQTASLQASPRGRPLYERLGFRSVGSLHLYEQIL